MKSFFLTSYTLLNREVVRFLRQKNRILGALGTPLVFWLIIGSGLGGSFHVPSGAGTPSSAESLSYLQYFFPGTILLILLFTAIFSTISIIEDRREGFLQSVLVAPVSRSSVVLGKLLGGTILALTQGLLFFLLVPFLGFSFGIAEFFYLILIIFLISFGLTGLGFIIAWRLDSTQGFHAIMNLFLMPLWLVSGAAFPLESGPAWLKTIMLFNPLTYAVSGLHLGLLGTFNTTNTLLSSPAACAGVCGLFAVLMFFLSVQTSTKRVPS